MENKFSDFDVYVKFKDSIPFNCNIEFRDEIINCNCTKNFFEMDRKRMIVFAEFSFIDKYSCIEINSVIFEFKVPETMERIFCDEDDVLRGVKINISNLISREVPNKSLS